MNATQRKKIVRKANLCLRFYRNDGWNRSEVANLLDSKRIEAVIPRYYNLDQDDEALKAKKGFLMQARFNSEEYLNCDYYAVYSRSETFNKKLLDEQCKIDSTGLV
ncbi:hypothetical protein AB4254_12035 [Vibrio breoganii]